MINLLKIIALTVLTTLFYWYVGQQVPQKETYPPESTEIRSDMNMQEMVEAGSEIASGKGTCFLCHTVGSHGARAPDLAGIGQRAGERIDSYNDVEYLAESLYEPMKYVVEGYNPIMTPAHKAPINLTEQEILAVIAYLQSLGGSPSVSPDTKLKYFEGGDVAPATVNPTLAATPADPTTGDGTAGLDAKGMLTKYACIACHNFDQAITLLGPPLHDVGARLTKAEIYESLLDPDATIAEGFQKGLMMATLRGTGFYEQVNPNQLKELVDYLSDKKGN